MSRIKIDNNFTESPEAIDVGPLGIAMHLAAICYSNTHHTNGYIPYNEVQKLLSFEFSPPNDSIIYKICVTSGMAGEDIEWKMVVDWLIEAGLWHKVDYGYSINDNNLED